MGSVVLKSKLELKEENKEKVKKKNHPKKNPEICLLIVSVSIGGFCNFYLGNVNFINEIDFFKE